MWGTFILDSYHWEGRRALAAALEEIASPRDAYGFASGGVYCFWRVESREVLYIGRAVDLPERFAQHNGFRGSAHGSKRKQIGEHFDQAEELGFSVLVRSSTSQTNVARHLDQVEADFGPPGASDWGGIEESRSETEMEIAHAEGIALRSYRLAHGRLPPWNRMEGELSVWGAEMQRADSSGELMTGAVDALLQARCSVAELAGDPTATQFESVLQLARSTAVRDCMLANEQLSDLQIIHALDRMKDPGSVADRERIRDAGYILERCRLSVASTSPVAELRRAWSQGRPLPAWAAAPRLR